jgi:hypothetical protein
MRRAWCKCTNEWLGRKQAKKFHIILWERILSRIVRDNYRRGGQLGSNKNRESDLPGYNSIASRPHQKLAPRKTKLEDAVQCGGVHETDRRRHVHKDLLGRCIYNIPQPIISSIRFAILITVHITDSF